MFANFAQGARMTFFAATTHSKLFPTFHIHSFLFNFLNIILFELSLCCSVPKFTTGVENIVCNELDSSLMKQHRGFYENVS